MWTSSVPGARRWGRKSRGPGNGDFVGREQAGDAVPLQHQPSPTPCGSPFSRHGGHTSSPHRRTRHALDCPGHSARGGEHAPGEDVGAGSGRGTRSGPPGACLPAGRPHPRPRRRSGMSLPLALGRHCPLAAPRTMSAAVRPVLLEELVPPGSARVSLRLTKAMGQGRRPATAVATTLPRRHARGALRRRRWPRLSGPPHLGAASSSGLTRWACPGRGRSRPSRRAGRGLAARRPPSGRWPRGHVVPGAGAPPDRSGKFVGHWRTPPVRLGRADAQVDWAVVL